MKKFEFGPVQQLLLKNLRKYPNRQICGILGKGTPQRYKACCLGEYLLCKAKIEKLPIKDLFSHNELKDKTYSNVLGENYDNLGLYSSNGSFITTIKYKNQNFRSLSDMNDDDISWPEIADIIEKYPRRIFTKSV